MVVPTAPPIEAPARRTAAPLAMTASVARAETVIAVPSAMAKAETMPAIQRPFSIEKVSTMRAPEQGLSPTATTALQASRTLKSRPEISFGSGK